MRIGIDIDDTITNSWKCLIPYYSQLFNIPEEELHKRKPYYAAVENMIGIDEFFEKIKPIYDGATSKITLKDNVKETIDKLYDLGCKVYFITARGKGFTDPYKVSKDYLDKHHIKYEKLIVNAWDKSIACREELIDLFIDDSYKHCKEVAHIGINVLMPTEYYNQEYTEFTHINDFSEVYDYVVSNGGKL